MVRKASVLAVFLCLLAGAASAQIRPVVDTIPAGAASGLMAIVQAYQKEIASNPRDASLWHDFGMTAWRASRALEKSASASTEGARVSRLADSGLAMAAALEPNNVAYQMDMAWKLQASKIGSARTGSLRYLERAIAAARMGKDPSWRTAAALELGRLHWWRFDAAEHRNQFTGPVNPRSLSDAMNPLARSAAEMEFQAKLKAASEVNVGGTGNLDRDLLNVSGVGMTYTDLPTLTYNSALQTLLTYSKSLPGDLSGLADLEKAASLFAEAYSASPLHPGAFRAVAATWVARTQWGNLERFAASHIRIAARDSLAWLALGLAQYRQGKLDQARRTFDSALVLLGPRGRQGLTSWTRTLAPHVAARLTPAERASREALYWKTANPFWSDETRDPRIEFLARVTHAELRWTVEEFGLSGADSDRGDVFIRYGPPERIFGFGQNILDQAADVVSFWTYPSGLMFAFHGLPTFAMMRTPGEDVGMAQEMKTKFPVKWDNIDTPKIDTLVSYVSRFRSGADSVDLAIGVEFGAPDSIARTMSIAAPVLRHLWILPTGRSGETHRSAPFTSAGTFKWREKVAPGTLVYRAEAFAETATRGSRVTGIVDVTPAEFPLTGFGLSDLMVTSRVTEPATPARRWTDLDMAPSVGRFAPNAPVTFVWENYEFGERAGQAEYDATLSIRNRKSGAGQIAAEIIGALSRLARIDRASDQTTISFSRTVPRAAAFADWITVQMTGAPKGEYEVVLTVTDRITQKQAVRSTRLTIRE